MLGPLIGAATSLIGGVMGQNAQREAVSSQERMAQQNIALQKEFAQSGIQWKVADAKAAGIHPLYALGANTTSFSPVSVGSPSSSPLGEGIARAGQDVSRAMAATSSSTTRMLSGLTLERGMLENELLRTQIAKARQQTGPPMPTANSNPWMIPGQGDSIPQVSIADVIKAKPHEFTPTMPNAPYAEAGPMPSIGWARTARGGYQVVPSKDFKDRAEDMGMLPWIWSYQNYGLPNLGINRSPPAHVALPPGHEWQYSPVYQDYIPGRKVHPLETIPGFGWIFKGAR